MAYVVVQADGSQQPVVHPWRTPPHYVPAAAHNREWDNLCVELVKRAVGVFPTSTIDVFLVLDQTEYVVGRDRQAIREVIRRARERSWGARILVVLSKAPSIARVDLAERADFSAWMGEIRDGRVSDILQIDESVESVSPQTLWKVLKNRTRAFVERQDLLFRTGGTRPWRCVLPPDFLSTAAVLGIGLATTSAGELDAFDLVILVADATPEGRQAQIARHLARDPDHRRRYRVVTYDPSVLYELEALCESLKIAPPVVLGGDFELWYLMLRLQELASSVWCEPKSVDPTPISSAPSLTVSSGGYRLSILLTSAFEPQESAQCLEAATDVGRFLHLSPSVDFHVELAIDTTRLLQVLAPMPSSIDAWIHVGHGSGSAGLWIPRQGHVQPQQWTDCFRGKELRLAMFLTCDSRDIARHFATEGTGVAIGFEGRVSAHTSRELARGVLEMMVRVGVTRPTLLAGFHNGAGYFFAVQPQNARPRAYYSRQA
jgi:hypothetical protein